MSSPHQSIDDTMRPLLLGHVRRAASWILAGRKGSPPPRPTVGGRFGGAFVTFYRGTMLRGCVGTFLPITDLPATLEEVTRSSLKDPRFRGDPITLEELPKLTVEVSVLTDPMRTEKPESLSPGVHGVIIRRGNQSGCFLPKVAEERGWNAEEFLSQCCTMKAGLPADAWKQSDTDVFLFSAESFSDADHGDIRKR